MVDWSVLENNEIREVLQRAVQHVENLIKEGREWIDFEAYEITPKTWLIKKLYEAEILNIAYRSSRHTSYAFAVPLEEVKARLMAYEDSNAIEIAEEEKTEEIPQDFWDTIEGYDDLKEVFLASLKANSPVHILLIGPPATGKSLILMEIERLKGSIFITAGTATKIGLRDILLECQPRYLLIDEIDKINNPNDLSVLLTLMEAGRVVVAKHKTYEEKMLKTWVFCGCNRINKLPLELLDRFQKFYLKPYDKETLIHVIKKTLVKREKIEGDLASYIAQKVSEYSDSVREAIRLARLCSTKGEVDKMVKIFKKYKNY